MSNPKIKIQKDIGDRVLEWLGWMAIVVLVSLLAYYFDQLPNEIITKFDFSGNPTRYNNKFVLILIVILELGTYFGLYYLNKFPHIFNYSSEITEDNAERQYTLATKLLRQINTITAWLFVFIMYQMTNFALTNGESASMWFVVLYLIGLLIFLFNYMTKTRNT